ncbi:MAG: deoxyribonuclease IV [Deltaproteobacteria bacterium]
MLLGVHVSIAGHVYEAVTRAEKLGCNVMQIFSRDPRQWRKTKIQAADIEEFRKRRKAAGIRAVFVHVPYLVNLASPEGKLFYGSIRAVIEDIKEAEALGVEYMVLHSGSHKKKGENFGFQRVSKALNRILEKTRDCKVKLLLENTAGSGSWLGYKFMHHRKIIARVEQKERVGVCLDTCHAYAAGYDLATREGFDRLAGQIEEQVGFERLGLVHLNDCASGLGSHYDIHTHIGKGNIGLNGFRLLLKDPRFSGKPFILETPKEPATADKKNLKTVRGIVEEKTG